MEKNTLKRVASHVLAIVMTLSVLVLVNSREAGAADLGETITGSGKQTVTITDEQSYGDGKKKKALSPEITYSTSVFIDYGVKKGTTYNLRVQAERGTIITATFTNVRKDGGAKQSKAKSLKKGKWVKGYIVAGSSSSRWYKVTRNSTGKLSFQFRPYVTNSLQVTIKGPGMKPYKFSAKSGFAADGRQRFTTYNPGGTGRERYFLYPD